MTQIAVPQAPPCPASTDWVPVWGSPTTAVAADFRYLGDWVAGTYNDGDIVVYQGIAYLCVAPTNAAPVPWTSVGSNYGTSFPASPADGAEFVLVDSVTAPTYTWRFRYNAGSTSPYKWEYIGGTPARHDIQTDQLVQSTTPADLATVGPTLTIPRAGDYDVAWGCKLYSGGTTGTIMMGVSVNGLTPNDPNDNVNATPYVTGVYAASV